MPLPDIALAQFNRIATGELDVNSFSLVFNPGKAFEKITEAAQNLGGDNDYQIDIGV